MREFALQPFPSDPELLAIAIAYKNARFIADQVMPRVPVPKQEFKYWTWPKGEYFTIPKTLVGRKGQPNKVEFSATEATASCLGYGLADDIPNDDLENAPDNFNIIGHAVESIADLVALDREKRVADLVFAAGQYASGNKTQLSGTSQWSDYTNSTPIIDISTGLDACIMRPNVMVIGRLAWSKLAGHPDIMKAVNRTAGDTGIARRQDVAALFELEEILVGEAFYNTAKKGQTVSLSRLWGKHASLILRDQLADTRGRITFGYTAQWGSKVARQDPDKNIGLRGGVTVVSGEYVKEAITANDMGYFVQDAVA